VITLAESLSRACSELGLKIELDFVLQVAAGVSLTTIARIPELGARQGMLIFTSFDEVEPFTERLAELGYGFSVLSERRRDEPFDLESKKEMFRDWGWSGARRERPKWM
jgi:hypothetical protein